MNILIVEDDENVRRFLRLLLSEQGHAVEEAANGQEGLARAREHRPDLIISDGLMPVMDGFQFLQALKADPDLSSIPFIFLSAVFTGQRELDLARSLGASAFLVKPQPPAVILEAIKAATANPPAAAPGVTGGSARLAEEYSRIVATMLEEKVRELRNASDEWRSTFDAMTEAIALLDADGRIMRCNKAMTLLAEKPYNEIIGLACSGLCGCFVGSSEECPFIRCKTTLKRETALIKKGDQWFETAADPILDVTGTLKGAVHILQNITERKLLVDALRDSGEKFRNFFESANDSLFIIDMGGKFIDVNRVGYERLGYTKEEMLAKNVAQLDPPEFAAKVPERIAQIAKYGQAVFESAHIKRSGAVMPVEINSRIIDFEGRKALLSVVRDITERKKAEEILKKREAQLAESQRIAGIGSWERNLSTNAVMWSKELYRIFGLDPERVAPSFDILMGLILPEDRESQKKDVQEAIQSKKPYRSDFRIVKPDGTTAVIHSQGEVVCDGAGRPVLLKGTAQDITERKQMEDALKAAVIRAEDEKARSDSIIAAIGDGISIQDRNFRILYENEAQKKMVGDHVGELCYMAYEQKEERCEGCGVAQVFKDGGTHVVERSAPTDKGMVHVEITASPLRDSKGDIVAGIEIAHNITERKKAENLMREQQHFTENLIINSAVATFVLDADHRVLTWNRACEELTGVPAAEMVGTEGQWKPFYDHKRPVLADIVLGREPEKLASFYSDFSISALLPDGLHAEGWYKNLNSKDRYIVFDATPIRNSAGTVIAAIENLQDITERKQAEDAVQESEKRYRAVVENAFDMIQSIAPDGRFLYVNPAWARTIGYSPEELRTMKIFDIISPACQSKCSDVFSKVKQGTPIEHFETQYVAKNGRVVDLEGNASARIVDGAVEAIQCLLHDVTERNMLEEQIHRSKQDWEYTFNSITDMVTVHDVDYNIIMANKAAQKILGLPLLEKMKDRKCFAYYHGIDHAPEGCPSCGCLQTGAPASFETFEPHLNMFIEIRAIPRFDSNGNLIGLIHVVRDITERKQLEQQIKMHTEHLETVVQERTRALEDTNLELQTVNRELVLRREEADAASRAKTDFLANMSHELRTPLNAIMGFSEIMLMGMAGPVSDKQREFLNDISKSGNHLLSLINDILDLSKVEAGKMELEPEPVIIDDLVAGATMMFKEKALKHAIKLDTIKDPAVADIIADRRKLKQVLVNLLSNAFKFTPDGGSVTVAARRIEGEMAGKWEEENKSMISQPLSLPTPTDLIEISVSDTGVGITPEHQKKLFQPFEQIDSSLSRKHAGTGLGLSLCRRFVELHGGRIWVESEPGKGSTFSFVIPVRRP